MNVKAHKSCGNSFVRGGLLLCFCLALFAGPFPARAQFILTTNNGAITVSEYTGTNANVAIPAVTNGLPVTSVGSFAFQYNTYVTSVVIPANVTNIGGDVFYFCTNLNSVSLPVTLTTIGGSAFAYCSRLTSAAIPANATNIGSGAFMGCSNLLSITIPNGVTAIQDSTFSQCGATNLTIPATVTSIGNYVFEGCTRLASIVIPASVTSIGFYSFNAGSLTNITVDASNPNYSSLNGVLFNKNQTVLVEYPGGLAGNYVIPTSVTNFAGAAFQGSFNPTSITILSNITSIPANTFSFCYGMSNIIMPNTITNIGQMAFEGSALTSVTIPNGVISIGQQAFSGCLKLTNATIPASVTNLASSVFYESLPLTQINVDPANPAYRSIGGVLFDKAAAMLIAFPPGIAISNYTVPDTVKDIAVNAFAYAVNLTNVLIPASVTNIDVDAFLSCANFKSAYCEGAAPTATIYAFQQDTGIVYYLPGTTGWTNTFGGLPTATWSLPYPTILSDGNGAGFGIQSNQFGFNVSWAAGGSVIVKACTNIANPVWVPLATNTLSNGTFYFSDAQWKNYPKRYYRVSTQ